MRRLSVLLCALLIGTACSEPPNKELHQAQGAVDAARAAGAEQYASETFKSATASLQQANDAVAQRDYRLALARALDASERAQESAKQAADGKAKARSDAERSVNALTAAERDLQGRITAADAARVPPRELQEPRRIWSEASAALQKARAALLAGSYLEASDAVQGKEAQVRAEIRTMDEAAAARTARRPVRKK